MTVVLNGRTTPLPEGASLADAVATLTGSPSGIAVAVDGEVVPRTRWSATLLSPGAVVEVVTAVQGG